MQIQVTLPHCRESAKCRKLLDTSNRFDMFLENNIIQMNIYRCQGPWYLVSFWGLILSCLILVIGVPETSLSVISLYPLRVSFKSPNLHDPDLHCLGL